MTDSNTHHHIKLPEGSIEKQTTTLNLGPTHPATHGVFQNIMEIDGERVLETVPTIGYIHRAFEKIAERRPYYQITPLTDRLNYCSAPINNMGWHMTVEKLIGAELPKRVDYMRVIVMELARIADHIICNSVIGVDTGLCHLANALNVPLVATKPLVASMASRTLALSVPPARLMASTAIIRPS
mgnify:CR=1 FL=1